jgi:Rrf2 family transcriptional regulator, iron-sulfur cluster assembly transcription factor
VLRLPKKLLFAIEAVLDIAYNAGPQPVQSRDITARQGIPRRYLEQVLQSLVRAGILAGVRGPRGGYRLARERRRITVGDITRVVAQIENGEAAEEKLPDSSLGTRVVRPMWFSIQDTLLKTLDTFTIEDLCLKANQVGIESEARKHLDFSI